MNGIFFSRCFVCGVQKHNPFGYVDFVFCHFTKFTDYLQEIFVIGVFRVFYIYNHIICQQQQFYFFLSCVDAFYFFFLASLLWLGLPVVLLILGEKVSSFHHWIWRWLCVCHIWPLLGGDMLLLHPTCWVLCFMKGYYILSSAFPTSTEIMIF